MTDVIETDGQPAAEVLPADLAAEANHHWRLGEQSHRSTLEHLWHAGRALKAVKVACQRGEWELWCAENFEGGVRNARRCIRVAEAYPEGWPEDLRVSVKSLNGALAYLDKKPAESAGLPPNGGQFGREEAEAAKQRLAKASQLGNVRDWAAEVEAEKAAAASTAAELDACIEPIAAAEKALAGLRKDLKRHAKALRDAEQSERESSVSACLAEHDRMTKSEIASLARLSVEDVGRALQGLKRTGRVRVVRQKRDDGSWLSSWRAVA
jgi:hypothetical protein